MKMLRFVAALLFLACSAGYLVSAEINSLNTTDASNTARFPENMSPSAVNDGARALEGILARWHNDINCSRATTGSSNAYVFSAAQTLGALYDGLVVCFDANHSNSGASTLNVDSLGAKAIRKNGSDALVSGDIVAGGKYVVVYDGTNFQLISPPGTTNVADGSVTTAKLASPTGSDTNVVTGTAGTNGNLGQWNGDGDLVDGPDVLDEDDLSSDSDSAVATQQSIKAYVDNAIADAGYQFVSSTAITAASTLVVTGMEDGYDYEIALENFAPNSDGQGLWMVFSDDDGSTYESNSGDYHYSTRIAGAGNESDSETKIILTGAVGLGNDSGSQNRLTFRFTNPNNSSERTSCDWHGGILNTDAPPTLLTVVGTAYFRQGTDAVSAIRFQWSGGGNFKAQGDVTVWRRKRS